MLYVNYISIKLREKKICPRGTRKCLGRENAYGIIYWIKHSINKAYGIIYWIKQMRTTDKQYSHDLILPLSLNSENHKQGRCQKLFKSLLIHVPYVTH